MNALQASRQYKMHARTWDDTSMNVLQASRQYRCMQAWTGHTIMQQYKEAASHK